MMDDKESPLPDIQPLQASGMSDNSETAILKTTSGGSLAPSEPQKEVHIMTDRRRKALQKAREAKKMKRVHLDASLAAQNRMNDELSQVLSDMKSALNEFKQSKPLPLANTAVQTEPIVQDVLANTPVATLANEQEDIYKMSLKPLRVPLPDTGFKSFLQNKVRF